MKILQLCLSDGKGGLELYALNVIKGLNENEKDLHAVALPGSFLARKLDEAGINYSGLQTRCRKVPLISARRLARLIEEEKIDILHMHWGKDLNIAAMAKWLSRRPVKLIYTRQMEISASKKDIYHSLLYGQVDRFIAITEDLKAKAIACLPLPEGKIKRLYYGVPEIEAASKEVCSTFFKEAGVDSRSFKVGLFGRIEHFKGQHLLVDAVKKLVDNGHNVEALMIGHVMDEGYFKSLLKEIDDKRLKDRVHYYGFHPKPMEVMSCFDVVLLTTYSETFGLVLIEAMRSGTAVIGTNAGGVPEIIDEGQTGLLFEPGDAKGLAHALEKFIDDPSFRDNVARQGKEKADEMFSEERHFQELEKIYQSLLSD